MNENVTLYENERIDQLYANAIQIIQSSEVFSFSLDAVLLANFPQLPKRGQIVDLCSGNGAVSLFMSQKTPAKITQIELQARLSDMAKRSVALNQKTEQIQVIQADLKEAPKLIGHDCIDLIVCNPPYFKDLPTNHKNPNPYLAIARHEIHTNLETVIQTSAKLLKMNGRLALVHRPERFLEIIEIMQKYQIMPKRVQFVYPKADKAANILLVEGILHGKKDGFKVLPPIYTYDAQSEYTPEIKRMLYGNE